MSRNDASDEAIITALLASPTIEEAARACKISTRTIHRRFGDYFFVSKLEEAVEGIRSARKAQALSVLDEAFDALREIMRDPAAPPSSRVRAAEVILARLWR